MKYKYILIEYKDNFINIKDFLLNVNISHKILNLFFATLMQP